MTDRQAEKFVVFILGRCEHFLRLAAVSNERTMARYLVAAHFALHQKFKAVALALDEDPPPPPPK